MLPDKKRIDGDWDPPLPFILAAWCHTPHLSKMVRFQEHIDYAYSHGIINKIDAYLRSLKKDEWLIG